jgi:threonine/homoserine/homoserine lactone efflux protein
MNPEIPPLTLLLVSAVFFTVLSWIGVCVMLYFIYDIVSTTIKSKSIK